MLEMIAAKVLRCQGVNAIFRYKTKSAAATLVKPFKLRTSDAVGGFKDRLS